MNLSLIIEINIRISLNNFDLFIILGKNALMINDLAYSEVFMTRHAAQDILSHALEEKPLLCCGTLLGENNCIDGFQSCQSDERSNVAQQARVIGLYHSYDDFDGDLKVEDVLKVAKTVGLSQDNILFFAIILSTKGRVETVAYYIHKQQLSPLKLVMLEADLAKE
ncbi:MAG: hypothetical protein Q9M28_07620 [Mariprofundaceae bacterium]|nr:hypothetical protein [Mariprofundaceae bacterium]